MKKINLEPVITETSLAATKSGWYTFKSPLEGNKNQLKKLVEENFKVNVLAIKTLIVKSKSKRSRVSRRLVRRSNWKKVLVKVKEGQKIAVFEQA